MGGSSCHRYTRMCRCNQPFGFFADACLLYPQLSIGVEFVRIQAGLAYQFSRKASSRWMYNCLVRLTWMRLDFCRLSWGRFWWWLFVERRHVCLPATTILMSITSYWCLLGVCSGSIDNLHTFTLCAVLSSLELSLGTRTGLAI